MVTAYLKIRYKYYQLGIMEHGKAMLASSSLNSRQYHYEKLIELSLKQHFLRTKLLQRANLKEASKIIANQKELEIFL